MLNKQGTITILLADDDEDDVEFFSDAVRQVNAAIKLHAVYDGSEALEYLKSADKVPDCIFLDLNMPRINGLECLQQIRNMDALKELAVFIYSTSNNSREISEAMKSGATHYIIKTFSFTQLTRKLNLILSDVKNLRHIEKDAENFVL